MGERKKDGGEERGVEGREREGENSKSNSKTLFYNDCSLGSERESKERAGRREGGRDKERAREAKGGGGRDSDRERQRETQRERERDTHTHTQRREGKEIEGGGG